MSRRGDDDGFRPHPGDPWHPGWASGAEAPLEAEPEASADEAGPGEPAPAPESRRRRFGRGRRRERPDAGAAEEPSGDELERPGLEAPEPAGWWAAGAKRDETAWGDRAATAPGDAGDEDGEEGEAPPSAPLFPWWGAAAPPEAPAPAAVRPAPAKEGPGGEPVRPGEGPEAASLVPLDLPARPAAAPPLPVVPGEAGGVDRWEEPEAASLVSLDVPARPAAVPAEAESGEGGLEALLEPVAEPDAASIAADLARAAAAFLAEMGEEPVVELLEESAIGGEEEDLPALPWVAESLGAEPGYSPEVGVSEESPAVGYLETPEEDLLPPSWALDASPTLEEEGFGTEPSGLVLASWEPAVDEPVAGTAAPVAEALPAVSEGPAGDSGMPALEAEVDEWLAFVEGTPAGATPASRRAAPSPVVPAGVPEFEIEAEAAPPSAARPQRGGRFGRRRRRGASGEEGWPERAWAAEAAEAEEGGHQPPPWAAAALPSEEAVAAPVHDEGVEAESAWEAWRSAEAGGAPEAEAAPSGAARPGPAWAEPEEAQGGAALGGDWSRPGPSGAVPVAAGDGGASVEEDSEEPWEEAEWTGEPETGTAWPAEVDEDEVEVPPAGLPEEEWETGDEPPSLAPEEPQRWPGTSPQPPEAAEPEAASEEEWAAAGWEVFPQPGEPLPRETGALPRGREPLTTEPEEAVDEGLEASGWETFPEPGRRPPRWPEEEAGRKPASPSESEPSLPGPGDPLLPGPYPARAGAGAEPTMEIPPVDVFDFERRARRQGPISEEVLSGAVTMEHRGLAEEVAAADTAETELQALSAPMPGLESGVVGFEDVAHLSSDEEMAAPVRSDLPVRVATGMVLAALLLGSLWVGGEFFAGFVGLLVMLGLGEFYGSLRRQGYQPLALFGFLGGSGLLTGTWFFGPVAIPVAVVATTVLTFFYYAFAPHRRDALANGGLTVLGMLWVTGTAAFAFPIAASPDFRVLILAVAAAVIATDVGAFFAGRAWGARPLAPVLSPRKTWEGLTGGVVLGIGAAVAAGYFFDPIGMRAGAALGLVVAIMAPLGDLAESMVKRSLGIKDMGATLPGHGGILDRVDAFLFVLPAAWVLFETMGLLR